MNIPLTGRKGEHAGMTGATRSAETARALICKTKRATRRRFPTEEKIPIVMEEVRNCLDGPKCQAKRR
jgi:hypothetical protein